MGKKKDCFGQEDYVCMTPNCPYARDCIKVVWEKRMDKVLSKSNKGRATRVRKTRSRVPAEAPRARR